MRLRTGVAWAATCLAAGVALSKPTPPGSISNTLFGHLPEGSAVALYTLRNPAGMEARIATYGGIVVSFTAPDRTGHFTDVVLGFDTLQEYLEKSPYFGALIGRYGNRIAGGTFQLNGHTYQLAKNDHGNSLHGGRLGFDKVLWHVAHASVSPHGPRLTLTYLSRDGEEGYPGNLTVTAVYTLTPENELWLEFTATTDQDTVVNLTHHSYFNLRGEGDVLDYVVQINAQRFTPIDPHLIPTGELGAVAGTPFDFRSGRSLREPIRQADEQLMFGHGYDHNWVLNDFSEKPSGHTVQVNATVSDPKSGRILEVRSSAPGLQFYTGNFLDGSLKGKGGRIYGFRSGFCMEPQHFPDSPHHPNFPSTVLKAGQVYRSSLVYAFRIY